MRNIFLSPHDDDSVLFGAFTCIREKPLVVIVTDAHIQSNRGEVGCDAYTRAMETVKAHEILGVETCRLSIPDSILEQEVNTLYKVFFMMKQLATPERVYIPAHQGGNRQHDLVHMIAKQVFGKACIEYTTYTKTELWTTGNTEIVPTSVELKLKNEALECYVSQINLRSTRPHFEAVKDKSEWLNA